MQEGESVEEFVYRSKLSTWDSLASVRVKPRRLLTEEDAAGRIYFPPELVPVVSHSLIRNLGELVVREVLIQRLYLYLDFTAMLEHDVVNRVAQRLAGPGIGVDLPEQMRFDAYKIYCDEAYHALFSVDLKRQIAAETGVVPRNFGSSRCLQRLKQIQDSVPVELREMAEVFFTIVSETLISSILCEIPHDMRVVSTVRDVIADHAEDEGKHHAYFCQLLEALWPRLNRREQAKIGPLLPAFILAFLEPDLMALATTLMGHGLSRNDVEAILLHCYPRQEVLAGIKKGAHATLRLFERNGVLQEPATLDAFLKSGLIN